MTRSGTAERSKAPPSLPPPPLPVVLAVNVITEREARGWSQEQLAVFSHTTRETIGKIEAGREASKAQGTTGRTIEKIADAIGIHWTELVRVRVELQTTYDEAMRVMLDGTRVRPSVIPGQGDKRSRKTYVDTPLVAVAR